MPDQIGIARRSCVNGRRLILLFALAFPLAAQNATQILKDFVAAEARNDERLNQYTYVVIEDHFWIDKQGKRKDETKTTERMFVEGEPYSKLILRNGKPLDPKEEAFVQKRLKATASQRRASRLSQATHPTARMASREDLLSQFDARLIGDEMVEDRKVWVVECLPKAVPPPANKQEKEIRNSVHKLWIDQNDHVLVRQIVTVIGKATFNVPGTTFTNEYRKIGDDVWAPSVSTIKGMVSFAKMFGGPVNTEYRYTDFKKFDVKSTITVN